MDTGQLGILIFTLLNIGLVAAMVYGLGRWIVEQLTRD